MAKFDIRETITNQVIEAIESGMTGKGWSKPWNLIGMATNAKTKKAYRGLNSLVLSFQDFESQYYATFKQWSDLGGKIKKGSKSIMITIYKPWEKTSKSTGEKETGFYLNYARVFNLEQVEIDNPERFSTLTKPLPITERNDALDTFVTNTGAEIKTIDPNRAYYSPNQDFINMPSFTQFNDVESYYATLLHELAHWTGHKSRLDRDLKNAFGSKDYAFEELVAELSSAMLCAELQVTNTMRDCHKKYLIGWLTKLKSDKTFIFKAAGKAQKVCDHLQALQAIQKQSLAA